MNKILLLPSLSTFLSLLQLQVLASISLLVFGYDTSRSITGGIFSNALSSSPSKQQRQQQQPGVSPAVPVTECAIVGVGVLGTSLCKQLLDDPAFKNWKFTGITKSTKRHDQILNEVNYSSDRFELRTAAAADDDNKEIISTAKTKKFDHCIFCAPPSGFDDYPSAIQKSMNDLWMGGERGMFIFTSSGGIYGNGDNPDEPFVVTESTTLPSNPTPRISRLIDAENVVLNNNGNGGSAVVRLAGLYSLTRGAHNYWLGDTPDLAKKELPGRADSLINLLHYDDAAGSVVAILKRFIAADDLDATAADDGSSTGSSTTSDDRKQKKGEVFLVSDGHPLTRQQICESSLKNKRYEGRTIPKFLGSSTSDPKGKIYDESYTRKRLKKYWELQYESFDRFMSSS